MNKLRLLLPSLDLFSLPLRFCELLDVFLAVVISVKFHNLCCGNRLFLLLSLETGRTGFFSILQRALVMPIRSYNQSRNLYNVTRIAVTHHQ